MSIAFCRRHLVCILLSFGICMVKPPSSGLWSILQVFFGFCSEVLVFCQAKGLGVFKNEGNIVSWVFFLDFFVVVATDSHTLDPSIYCYARPIRSLCAVFVRVDICTDRRWPPSLVYRHVVKACDAAPFVTVNRKHHLQYRHHYAWDSEVSNSSDRLLISSLVNPATSHTWQQRDRHLANTYSKERRKCALSPPKSPK